MTVKDMLEGDNMYTCSKCQKKVRAEKRSLFLLLFYCLFTIVFSTADVFISM